MRHPPTEERWVNDFAEDIHSHLRAREKERLPVRGRSTQLHLRPKILQLLRDVSSQKAFCVPVLHLAVYLVDAFLEGNRIDEEHWRLFALGCLSVAAKVEENGDLVPDNRELCYMSGDPQYVPHDVMQAEVRTLEYFRWDVLHPTAAHFVEYYELYATAQWEPELSETPIPQCIEYFLTVVLEDTEFYNYSPSMIAASCIASARLYLMVTPIWPRALRNVAQYKLKELEPCLKIMLTALTDDVTKARMSIDVGQHRAKCLNRIFARRERSS